MSRSHPVDTAHVVPLLEAYHAGALAPVEAAEVSRHLGACSTCRAASEEIALYRIIRAAPAPTVGPELRQRIYARISAASAAGSATPARTRSQPLQRERRPDRATFDYPRGAHVRGGWLSGVAAVALIALIATVFWLVPHTRQPGRSGRTAAPSGCLSTGATATLPTEPYVINDMAMTSATDGWAVGSYQDQTGAVTHGLVMRFNKCNWAPVTVALPNINLMAISMDSPSDGWAIGDNVNSNRLVVLHYSGDAWSVAAPPSAPRTDGWATSLLDMTSPNDGWLVVMGPGSVGNANVAAYAQTIFHDAQGTWSAIDCPMPMIDTIASVGPDDLWVAGRTFTGAGKATSLSFAHYQHGHWSVMAQPSGLITMHLSVTSPTDIWASGMTTQGYPVVARYDGASWRDMTQALPSGLGHTTALVTSLGDHDGWAFSLRTRTASALPGSPLKVAQVWRETAGQWQALTWGYTDIQWFDVWTPLPDGEIWAVGRYLTPGTFTPLPGGGGSETDTIHTVLLHYTNGAWTRYG